MNTTDPTPRTSRQAGTLTLTVWPDTPVGEHQRYGYRIEDTETGRSLEGRDLFTGAGTPSRLSGRYATSPDTSVRPVSPGSTPSTTPAMPSTPGCSPYGWPRPRGRTPTHSPS